MKVRRSFFIICMIVAVLAFTLVYRFAFYEEKDIVQPKSIKPFTGNSVDGSQTDSSVDEMASMTSFIPLLPTETLISTISMDFDGDTLDDQIVAVRKSGSEFLYLIVGLYNSDTNSYDRSAEISTEITKDRTFFFTGLDVTGSHKNALVYQGVKNNGDYVMKIFHCVRRKNNMEINTIGDFISDGTIFIQQTDRTDAYENAQAWGAAFPVWVYSSDKADEKNENSSVVSQVQTQYRWNYDEQKYVQTKQLVITGSKVAAKELQKIQNGNLSTFTNFLNGLWYKKNSSGKPSYIYFNYETKEIIFLSDDTEGVYIWEDSNLRRSGIYITSINSIISSMKRRFDIMVTNMDEVYIHVNDNVGMLIKETNIWDGTYKKMSFQNTFGDEKKEILSDRYVEEFEKNDRWVDDEGNVYTFKNNGYEIYGAKNGSGLFVIDTVAAFPVIQLCSRTPESGIHLSYAMKFQVDKVTVPSTRRNRPPEVKEVENTDIIHFYPVRISADNCYAVDGRSIRLVRAKAESLDTKSVSQ